MLFILQHFDPTGLQCAHQWGMFVEDFKEAGYPRQLNAIDLITKKFFFRCQNFKIHTMAAQGGDVF